MSILPGCCSTGRQWLISQHLCTQQGSWLPRNRQTIHQLHLAAQNTREYCCKDHCLYIIRECFIQDDTNHQICLQGPRFLLSQCLSPVICFSFISPARTTGTRAIQAVCERAGSWVQRQAVASWVNVTTWDSSVELSRLFSCFGPSLRRCVVPYAKDRPLPCCCSGLPAL